MMTATTKRPHLLLPNTGMARCHPTNAGSRYRLRPLTEKGRRLVLKYRREWRAGVNPLPGWKAQGEDET